MSGLGYVFSGPVARKSLIIAVVVGSILSAVNLGDLLMAGEMNAKMLIKIFMNFVIPFTVASVSAAANRKQQ